MTEPTITEIESEFLNPEGWKKTTPLDRERVLIWLVSDDLEILGVAHSLLFVKEHWPRLTPPLSLKECVHFRKHYYERCLREYDWEKDDEDWIWADNGFNAAHGAVGWFYELWKDKTTPAPVLLEVKNWLAQLVKERVQSGMLGTAVSDHLLSYKKLRKLFADWRDDPELQFLFNH